MIGRILIVLVWALMDLAQVAIARAAGTGDRAGDGPLVVFAVSALAGAVLLVCLAVVNLAAYRGGGDPTRLARARLIAWLCGVRLLVVVVVMAAARVLGDRPHPISQSSFLGLALVAFLDCAVALGLAARSVAAIRRSVASG